MKDAQAWARKIESEIERSLYIDTSESSKITLLELVSRYESTLDRRVSSLSKLFEKGLSIPEVAAISGHKTWAMLKRYTEFDLNYLQSKLD